MVKQDYLQGQALAATARSASPAGGRRARWGGEGPYGGWCGGQGAATWRGARRLSPCCSPL